MWMSRFLLLRVAEDHSIVVSFEPKIFADFNGSGCHCNFSTKTMRAGTGKMKYIDDMMVKFEKTHDTHMSLYGEDNDLRLTGIHETSSFKKFSYGVGNRAASFRIPTQVRSNDGKGYIEDRRPASNIDAYIVGSIIADTSILDSSMSVPLVEHHKKWTNHMKNTIVEKA